MDSLTRKKVLYVITKSNWGGAQKYVYDLATSLPKEQFEVAVALGGTGELEKKLKEADIPVLQLQKCPARPIDKRRRERLQLPS